MSNFVTLKELVQNKKLKLFFVFSTPRSRATAFHIALTQAPEVTAQLNEPFYKCGWSVPYDETPGPKRKLHIFEEGCERVLRLFQKESVEKDEQNPITFVIHEQLTRFSKEQLQSVLSLTNNVVVCIRDPLLQFHSFITATSDKRLGELQKDNLSPEDIISLFVHYENTGSAESLLEFVDTNKIGISPKTILKLIGKSSDETMHPNDLMMACKIVFDTAILEFSHIWKKFKLNLQNIFDYKSQNQLSIAIVDTESVTYNPEHELRTVIKQIQGLTFVSNMVHPWTKGIGKDFNCVITESLGQMASHNYWNGPARNSNGFHTRHDVTKKILKVESFPKAIQSLLSEAIIDYQHYRTMKEGVLPPDKKTGELKQIGDQSQAAAQKSIAIVKKIEIDSKIAPIQLTADLKSQPMSGDSRYLLTAVAPSVPLQESAEKLTVFLKLVAEGEQDRAEILLKQTPALAFGASDIIDLSGRIFKGITAFQYAIWALDWHMWTMILKYLPREDARKQILAMLKASWVKEHGLFVSWQNFLDALQIYADNCTTWTYQEFINHWSKQVGGGQFLFPAHVVNQACHPNRSFEFCPDFTQGPLPRNRKTNIGEWYTSSYGGGKLGKEFAYLRYSFNSALACFGGDRGGDAISSELLAYRTLLNISRQQRNQLFGELDVLVYFMNEIVELKTSYDLREAGQEISLIFSKHHRSEPCVSTDKTMLGTAGVESKMHKEHKISKKPTVPFQLYQAAKSGNMASLKQCLTHDFNKEFLNVAEYNDRGWSALHYACAMGHFDCARELILKGADIKVKDKRGKTPLELIRSTDITPTILHLLQKISLSTTRAPRRQFTP